MSYAPTMLTPSALGTFLGLRRRMAMGAYVLLSQLGGHMGAGWTGSVRRLRDEYHRRSGCSINRGHLAEGLAELEAVGLLEVTSASGGLRTYRLKVDHKVDRTTKWTGVDHKVDRGGPQSGPSSTYREKENREAAAARACPTLSSSSNYNEGLLSRLEPLGLSPQRASSLLSEVGAEEVERQLTLWPHRTEQERGWARVPGGAFVALCRQRAPEPESVRAARRADEENRAWQEAMRRAKEERVTREEYERAKEGAA